VVTDLVRVSDIGPTLLGLAGQDPVLGGGRDLGPALGGGPVPLTTVYLEATKPAKKKLDDSWNNSHTEHGIARGEHLLVRSRGNRVDRLYLLDDAQTPTSHDGMLEAMGRDLTAWEGTAPSYLETEMSSDVVDALKALGYMGDDEEEAVEDGESRDEDSRL